MVVKNLFPLAKSNICDLFFSGETIEFNHFAIILLFSEILSFIVIKTGVPIAKHRSVPQSHFTHRTVYGMDILSEISV